MQTQHAIITVIGLTSATQGGTTAATQGSIIYWRVKPAKLLPHTAHSDWINRTGLTSWAFTKDSNRQVTACVECCCAHLLQHFEVWPQPGLDTAWRTSLARRPRQGFFKLTVTIHRCLNGCAPDTDTRWHLRSASRQVLAVPRYQLNTYSHRSFSVAGPHSLELSPRFHPGPDHQCRLFQTFA